MRNEWVRPLWVILPAIILLLAAPAWAAPQRVAILPFSANAKEDISFLVRGVRDMLASRLAWQEKVSVLEPSLVGPVMKKIPPPYTDAKARQVGRALGVEVVVYGSITALGKSVSVDARLVKVKSQDPALTTYVHAKEMDEIIPRISDFAQQINAEIFERPDALAAREKAAQASQVKAADGKPDEIEDLPEHMSPLNPLFRRMLTGVDSDRSWRSPRINGLVQSICVADVDLDGKNELVALLPDSIRLYRLAGSHFQLLYEMKNGPRGTYLFVDAADIDGDGRPEIFVTNMNNMTLDSFVLEVRNGFRMKAKDQPYYFRVQPDPLNMKKKLLLGQKRHMDDPFVGQVYQMRYSGGNYVPEKALQLPEGAHVFNTLLADLNGGGRAMPVTIGLSYELKVHSVSGKEVLWTGEEAWAASSKLVKLPAGSSDSSTGYEDEWYYLFARLVLANLDGDDRPEVVLVQNEDRMQGLTEHMRLYFRGTIFSLYWNGFRLVEEWRTPRIAGNITDYAIADVGNLGRPALVMSVGQRMGSGFVSKGTSHLVAFTLQPQKKKKKVIKSKGL